MIFGNGGRDAVRGWENKGNETGNDGTEGTYRHAYHEADEAYS